MNIDFRTLLILVLAMILGVVMCFRLELPVPSSKLHHKRLILMANSTFLSDKGALAALAQDYIDKLNEDWDNGESCCGGPELYSLGCQNNNGNVKNLLSDCSIDVEEAKLATNSWLTQDKIENRIKTNFTSLDTDEDGCEQILFSLHTLKQVLSDNKDEQKVAVVYASSWYEHAATHDPSRGDYQLVSNNLYNGGYEFKDIVLEELFKKLQDEDSDLCRSARQLQKIIHDKHLNIDRIHLCAQDINTPVRISTQHKQRLQDFWDKLFAKAGLKRVNYNSLSECL
jgi:hypothetical protein